MLKNCDIHIHLGSKDSPEIMTASTGGGSCLAMSLSALKRLDPYISSITDLASQVALYTFNNTTNEWVNKKMVISKFLKTAIMAV